MNKELRSCEDLALFGGEPTFDTLLHVGAPNIGNRDRFIERVNDLLDRRRLTNNGPFVQEMEEKLSEFLDVRHVIAMANGTIALEIACRALELKGEVIMPSMTFIATAHALQWQEIRPVFCDIKPSSCLIDPAKIEQLVTPLTSGIIGVHLWARPCDIDALELIARRNRLKLIFDAAHAFGATYKQKPIGSFGDVEVFSFHATKFFNTFEGGAVVTNNDVLAKKIRLMKNFGFSGMDRVIYIGTNGKMNEFAAAMGLTLLEDIEVMMEANRLNYNAYQKHLRHIPGINILPYDQAERSNYQYIVLDIDEKISGLSRDTFLRFLHAENVIVRRYFYPGCHRMEPYKSYQPNAGLLLPETERLVRRVLTLPSGMAVSPVQIEKICAIIEFVVGHADEINMRFQNQTEKVQLELQTVK
jgi:dTDP-4-amino-4,6-dideoxygalactose transaminase